MAGFARANLAGAWLTATADLVDSRAVFEIAPLCILDVDLATFIIILNRKTAVDDRDGTWGRSGAGAGRVRVAA